MGKQLEVFLGAITIVRLGWADMPHDASTGQFYGVAVLCHIGLTMSLFIGNLAHDLA